MTANEAQIALNDHPLLKSAYMCMSNDTGPKQSLRYNIISFQAEGMSSVTSAPELPEAWLTSLCLCRSGEPDPEEVLLVLALVALEGLLGPEEVWPLLVCSLLYGPPAPPLRMGLPSSFLPSLAFSSAPVAVLLLLEGPFVSPCATGHSLGLAFPFMCGHAWAPPDSGLSDLPLVFVGWAVLLPGAASAAASASSASRMGPPMPLGAARGMSEDMTGHSLADPDLRPLITGQSVEATDLQSGPSQHMTIIFSNRVFLMRTGSACSSKVSCFLSKSRMILACTEL